MIRNKGTGLRPIQQRCFNPLDTVDMLSPIEPDQIQHFLHSHSRDIIVSRQHDPDDTQRRIIVLQVSRIPITVPVMPRATRCVAKTWFRVCAGLRYRRFALQDALPVSL
jgi:hypothetical protein